MPGAAGSRSPASASATRRTTSACRSCERPIRATLRVDALNDQHAFVRDPDGVLRVGDMLVCGISHPCTAFDKWSLIAVLDDDDVVIDAIRTLF